MARTAAQDKAYRRIPKENRIERLGYGWSTKNALIKIFNFFKKVKGFFVRELDTINGTRLGYKGDEHYLIIPKDKNGWDDVDMYELGLSVYTFMKNGYHVEGHPKKDMSAPDVFHLHAFRSKKTKKQPRFR